MDFLNEITKSFGNNDGVYLIVGVALFLIAIMIVRKIIAIATFVLVGLVIFALIKGTMLTPTEGSSKANGNSSYISAKVDAIKKAFNESVDFVKNLDKKADNAVDNLLDEKDKIGKQFDDLKNKYKNKDLEKILKNF